jgi:predicted small secreted protein
MFKNVLALIVVSGLLLLAGCNTMAGLGKDIQKGGAVLQKSADRKMAK